MFPDDGVDAVGGVPSQMKKLALQIVAQPTKCKRATCCGAAFGSRPLVLGLGITQADVAREASDERDTLLFAAQKKKHSNISQCLMHETCDKIVTTSLLMAVLKCF